jgi:rhodanese-related sulfurtransferase
VALALRRLGVTRVRPLEGGFTGWRERGFPLEPVPSPAAAMPAAERTT